MKSSIVLLGLVVTVFVAFGFNDYMAMEFETTSLADSNVNAEYSTPFDSMMAVLTHKRCVNCHPADNYPRQGEDSHKHLFGVERGEANHGVEATNCNTCHQSENNNFSGVPGAPEWSLAPLSMAWQGLSRSEIAASMLDRTRNGNRSHEEIEDHLTHHALVLWAFDPGVDAEGNPRETPPIGKEAYIKAVKKWFKNGAQIPAE
ncbi:MAG: hypothetical protein ACRBF0_01295 [Calditrichia bacterium]